jgi:hypothetical protein
LAIRVLQGDQGERSYIQVYGEWISSKRMELYATVTLFLLAFAAVLATITGQAYHHKEQETLLQNGVYVNSTIEQVDAAANPDL